MTATRPDYCTNAKQKFMFIKNMKVASNTMQAVLLQIASQQRKYRIVQTSPNLRSGSPRKIQRESNEVGYFIPYELNLTLLFYESLSFRGILLAECIKGGKYYN